MVNPDEIREESARELCSLMQIQGSEMENLRRQKIFNDYVEANIRKAEAMEAAEARCKDLNDTKHSIHEKIRAAQMQDVEEIMCLIEALERLSKLEVT